MRSTRAVVVLAVLAGTATGVMADPTCAVVQADLSGQNIFGSHTIKDLSDEAEAGNCTSAAGLARRALDAVGFAQVHCPGETSLVEAATTKFRRAEALLHTPHCQD